MAASSALSIPELGRFVDNLVEGRENVVGELDLRDRLHTFRCGSNGKPHDPLFCQWCIEDPIRSEFRLKLHGASEDAAKGHIFPEEEHPVRCCKGCSQCGVDGLVQVQRLRRTRVWEVERIGDRRRTLVEERRRSVVNGLVETG